jgi:hypothetical protein
MSPIFFTPSPMPRVLVWKRRVYKDVRLWMQEVQWRIEADVRYLGHHFFSPTFWLSDSLHFWHVKYDIIQTWGAKHEWAFIQISLKRSKTNSTSSISSKSRSIALEQNPRHWFHYKLAQSLQNEILIMNCIGISLNPFRTKSTLSILWRYRSIASSLGFTSPSRSNLNRRSRDGRRRQCELDSTLAWRETGDCQTNRLAGAQRRISDIARMDGKKQRNRWEKDKLVGNDKLVGKEQIGGWWGIEGELNCERAVQSIFAMRGKLVFKRKFHAGKSTLETRKYSRGLSTFVHGHIMAARAERFNSQLPDWGSTWLYVTMWISRPILRWLPNFGCRSRLFSPLRNNNIAIVLHNIVSENAKVFQGYLWRKER